MLVAVNQELDERNDKRNMPEYQIGLEMRCLCCLRWYSFI